MYFDDIIFFQLFLIFVAKMDLSAQIYLRLASINQSNLSTQSINQSINQLINRSII